MASEEKLHHFDPTSMAGRKVLKACPYYPELARLLRSSQSAGATSSQTRPRDDVSTKAAKDLEYLDNDDLEVLDIARPKSV